MTDPFDPAEPTRRADPAEPNRMTDPFDPAEPTRRADPAEPTRTTDPFDPAEPTRQAPNGGTDLVADDVEPGAHVLHDATPNDAVLDDAVHDDDYVYIDEHRGGCGRWFVVLLVLVGLVVAGAAAAFFWYQGQVDPSGPEGPPVAVVVPEGATSDDIGVLLADQDVISSSRVWGWYLRINGGGPFQAGEYTLPTNAAMGDVVALLEAGPAPPENDSVTVPEAFIVPEITARLADPERGIARWSAETLNQLLADGAISSRTRPPEQSSYEGLLFPDTYRVADDETEQAMLQRMADQMDAVLDELGADETGQQFGLSRYQVVIVASLIEEEAKVPGDRAKISRVIHNRLEQGIPLGIDATSRYEAILAGRGRDALDFDSDSPYNTRRVAGLPPTPIAAPGRDAIDAALNPEPGPWIFYVLADEQGNHFFTESNDEFLAAKRECEAKGLGCG